MTDLMNATSPLAKKLEELVQAGLVRPMVMPTSQDFPSARIVMPVYDSTEAGPLSLQHGGTYGRLARNT